jgi:CelD/BcsL family acetyltransferase involved in cellulose biosynthesis
MTDAEWWDLFRRDPRATPFQSPAWQQAWWAHLGGGERIDLEARNDDGRLIGLLPMHVWYDGGTRRLVPVAAGYSDYSDALIDPAMVDEALAGLRDAAEGSRDRWDELLLPDCVPIRRCSPGRLTTRRARSAPSCRYPRRHCWRGCRSHNAAKSFTIAIAPRRWAALP